MIKHILPQLNIGGLIAKVPIIQGGMGVAISLSGLASAVANAGGIGVLATPGIGLNEPDLKTDFIGSNNRALAKEIRKCREKTKGLIGVNIMYALTNYEELSRTAIKEGIDIIFSGAGLPMNLPEFLEGSTKTKLVPIVSSGRAAKILAKRWMDKYNYVPDGFVVEGPLAGGHIGFKLESIDDPAFSLENLLAEVLKVTEDVQKISGKKIPVIAGGGIFTGADIKKFLDLGASGVQMATRFVATDECDADIIFKQAYLDCKEEDMVVIKSPVGMPGRAIKNKFITDSEKGQKQPFECPFHCIITCDVVNAPYCIALSLLNAQKGEMDHGFAFAGKNAYRVTEIVPVKTLIASLAGEFSNATEEQLKGKNP
ncbi:MAG: nitronate monooxygenase family protein [Candidatus Firestonebacteria bacterium]|nr:nitronate monooxygenase family protein [Candidatus Firestonebacteria bacterium]